MISEEAQSAKMCVVRTPDDYAVSVVDGPSDFQLLADRKEYTMRDAARWAAETITGRTVTSVHLATDVAPGLRIYEVSWDESDD